MQDTTSSPSRTITDCCSEVAGEVGFIARTWQDCQGQPALQRQVAAIALAHFLREGQSLLQLIHSDSLLQG